jgi:hypothetical protein
MILQCDINVLLIAAPQALELKTMDKRKNILFSTTRQWNPGDEFILKGILNVIHSIDADFNPVIFNRSPEIERPESRLSFSFQINLSRMRFKRLKCGSFDNSFKGKLLKDNLIDLAVFAGTPEWASFRLSQMYEYIHRYSIPVVYLGIGLGTENFRVDKLSNLYLDVLNKAKLVIVRSQRVQKILSQLKPILLPCPSLLASPVEFEKTIGAVKKIALIYNSPKSIKNNKVDYNAYNFMIGLYRKLLNDYSQEFEFEFICHYIDELPELRKDFGARNSYYSYDSDDYFKIYNKFDLVIGCRVHGIGVAASMGIPGIAIRHDLRGSTCELFKADIIEPSMSLTEILKIIDVKIRDVRRQNGELLEYKRIIFNKYRELLLPILGAKIDV